MTDPSTSKNFVLRVGASVGKTLARQDVNREARPMDIGQLDNPNEGDEDLFAVQRHQRQGDNNTTSANATRSETRERTDATSVAAKVILPGCVPPQTIARVWMKLERNNPAMPTDLFGLGWCDAPGLNSAVSPKDQSPRGRE